MAWMAAVPMEILVRLIGGLLVEVSLNVSILKGHHGVHKGDTGGGPLSSEFGHRVLAVDVVEETF